MTKQHKTNVVVGKARRPNPFKKADWARVFIVMGILIGLIAAGLVLSIWVRDRKAQVKPETAIAQAKKDRDDNQPDKVLAGLAALKDEKLTTAQRAEANLVRGHAYQQKGDNAGAITAYKKSLNDDPSNTSLLLLVAQLAEDQKDYKTAVEYYQKAIDALSDVPQDKQGPTFADDIAYLKQKLAEVSQHE